MAIEASGGPKTLIQRAAAIILKPAATWAEIAAESATARAIFTGYVMILGAINPVCFALGRLIFGERVVGAIYRAPILAVLVEALISYGLVLAFVWALAFLIEFLAVPFGAVKDRLAAVKVSAYSATAGWLASVFYLVPALGVLALIGQLYTLYLLYRGVQVVLRPQQGRTLGYVALVVVCYAVLMMLVISLTKLLAALA